MVQRARLALMALAAMAGLGQAPALAAGAHVLTPIADDAGAVTAAPPAVAIVPRVVGGSEPPKGTFPFLTPLLRHGIADGYRAQYCGGTLIAPGWVLTAAHCVVPTDPFIVRGPTIDVAPGAYDLSSLGVPRVRVAQVIVHPQFNLDRIYPDVALLRLSHDVAGVTPVPIASPADDALVTPGAALTTAGWGATDPDGQQYPYRMRSVEVPALDDASCGSRYGATYIAQFMLCAGDTTNGGIDSCFGDSGGPLLVQAAPADWRQVGIVSYGRGQCANAQFPGVYTDIKGVRDWVAGVLAGSTAAMPAPVLVKRTTPRPTTLDLRWQWPGDPASVAAFRITVAHGPSHDVIAGRRSLRVLGLRPGKAARYTVTAIRTDGAKSKVATGIAHPPRDRKAPKVRVTLARVAGGVWRIGYRVLDDSWETRERVRLVRSDGQVWRGDVEMGAREPGKVYGLEYGSPSAGGFSWRVCIRATDRAGKSGSACRKVAKG